MALLQTFRTKVMTQLGLIVLALAGIAWVVVHRDYVFALMLLVPFVILLLYNLFHLVNKTNDDITHFLLSIKYDDYEQQYATGQLNDSQQKLYRAFNLIVDKFRHLRSEKEIQNQLMQTIIKQVDTGIFCAHHDGSCMMMNPALKQLLHKSYIPNFSAFQPLVPNLYEALNNLPPGERKTVREVIQNEILQIAVQVYILKIKDEEIKVYTFYNIHNELSDHEVQSWQKLIRILSHEIMNSITPIASISSSAMQMIDTTQPISSDDSKEIKEAFQIIQKRSEGLMRFTETYRKLTRIPPPKLETINLRTYIGSITKLFEKELLEKGIELDVKFLFKEIKLSADPILLEQVLINILKNAIEAVREVDQPKIAILADKTPQGKVTLQIIDNGPGIPQEVVDQIFVPFFTTKQNGSGIGLSLSQQIIRMHGGSIHLQSREGVGTVVTVSV